MKGESGYAAPIEAYREGKKAYYRYSDSNFSINQSPLNQSEAEQLRSAISILQRFEGSPEFEWVNEIGPMLKDQFGFKSDDRKIIGYESNVDYSGYEHISSLFNAISNKRVLEIIYKPFGKEEIHFDFHPYYLKQFNNRWFVFGRNESNGVNQWTVPLDRIRNLNEKDAEYTTDKTDWEDYFYDIVGVTKPIDKSIEKVELLVSKEQAPYMITKPLHASQRVYKNEDGSVRITIDVIPNYELECKSSA
jgi:predicted DNA-binding transcriptional regulator YafY